MMLLIWLAIMLCILLSGVFYVEYFLKFFLTRFFCCCREGHLNVVRVLLTESSIDAEYVNIKGRNPLHELCRCGKENAAAICDLFLECMPKYPINAPDVNGNSPLLLAYMKGNGNLCR